MTASADPAAPTISFAEKTLGLLDEASFSATYKHAVLLALIDCCREATGPRGEAPGELPVASLARRIVELYWPQTDGFPSHRGPTLLRQNAGGQARIVSLIARFRADFGLQSRGAAPDAGGAPELERLHREVQWSLANMPLPRLQRPYEPFIYLLDWDEHTARGRYFAQRERRIRFIGDSATHLVRLSNLLRPVVQRRWAALVARLNQDVIQDADLDRFLFDPSRSTPRKLWGGLRALQSGRCFYCARAVRTGHIDHFLPWAYSSDEGIENLVVACRTCNLAKSAHLAAAPPLERWVGRLQDSRADLADLSTASAWPSHPKRTSGMARSLYLSVPAGKKLWQPEGFVDAEREREAIEATLMAA
jgi:5-methylcytosine-specific restriction endonuclease McrA